LISPISGLGKSSEGAATNLLYLPIGVFMNVIPHAYRTTCIPCANRIETPVPNEYIGREIEIIMLPIDGDTAYNSETLAAMQEARDIMAGKVEAKRYKTAAEMHADILAEADD